jgi:periplasmic divalent cation tolerance protein
MHDDTLICLSTAPDGDTAARLASTLVEEHLAACVNQVPDVLSTYRWQGRIQRDAEVLLVIKTTRARLPELEARLRALHPYELPELIAVEIAAGSAAYLDWVRAACAPD